MGQVSLPVAFNGRAVRPTRSGATSGARPRSSCALGRDSRVAQQQEPAGLQPDPEIEVIWNPFRKNPVA